MVAEVDLGVVVGAEVLAEADPRVGVAEFESRVEVAGVGAEPRVEVAGVGAGAGVVQNLRCYFQNFQMHCCRIDPCLIHY